MKVLFAVSNEAISESIVKKYQQMYKEIVASKNVYYFNAILKELQKDKTYDRIVISEDLEPFTNNNYETIDNFIFEKLDNISDEAVSSTGEDIPIILITTDRRTKSDNILIKLFGIGVYSALLGQDRSIEEVCKLMQKPRSKKEAKIYYKIDSGDVDYKPENEGDVSEAEIQNILTHYKRLGRNEERYVESFDNIAAQYTDEQLKVIIKFLPLNVKVVLEENSTRYQQLMSFGGNNTRNANNYQTATRIKRKNNTDRAINNSGIKIESISSGEKKLTKPVIIPSASTLRKVKPENRVERPINIPNKIEEIEQLEQVNIFEEENINTNNDIQQMEQEAPKRKRGRPKKIKTPEEIEAEMNAPKKKRGRPRKNPIPEETFIQEYEEENEILPGFEQLDEEEMLPDFEEEENILPNYNEQEEVVEEDFLPGFEEEDEEQILPGFEEEQWQEDSPSFEETDAKDLEEYDKKTSDNIENLLSKDKKVVAFVGTSKNGTSFVVNNLAEMLSKQGIKTAILDLTKNRNAYYIYTKNEEELRKTAFACTEKLIQGVTNGIKVNANLDVYTSLPGENEEIEDYKNILSTLIQNYSLVLLDCDFSTQYNYLRESQEIYLVQSMDVLTIQPLTAYLRDLKAKGILEQSKLRVVINKYTKLRGISEKTIIGGMAFYNDPAMSFMTELFDREKVMHATIPFEAQVYSKYLESLINCEISLNGYTKEVVNALKKLANMVYPLIGSIQNKQKAKYNNPKYNQYAARNNINATLDKMKRNY